MEWLLTIPWNGCSASVECASTLPGSLSEKQIEALERRAQRKPAHDVTTPPMQPAKDIAPPLRDLTNLVCELARELETAPLSADASEMFRSERNALWMALLVLCPERLRIAHVHGDDSDDNIMRIAQTLKIPFASVRAIKGQNTITWLWRH